MNDARPLPVPTRLSKPFWDACAEGRLLTQRCTSCGRHFFPPQHFCRYCHADTVEWIESAGRGEIHSYSTVWRPQTPAFEVPYIVAIVRLDEGYDLLTNLVDTDPEAVAVGARVEVRFQPMGSMVMPTFTLERP